MATGDQDDRSEIIARLTAIEQKLQLVPTRDELSKTSMTRDELLKTFMTREELIATFATREELFANFATRDELRREYATRDEQRQYHEETRRHFDVIAESLRDDIRLLAEGQAAIMARLDASLRDRRDDRAVIDRHELRLTRLEKHAGFEPPPPPPPRRRRP